MTGRLGSPLVLHLADEQGNTASAATALPLQPAQQRAMSEEDVVKGVGQLGDNVLMPVEVDTSGVDVEAGVCCVLA